MRSFKCICLVIFDGNRVRSGGQIAHSPRKEHISYQQYNMFACNAYQMLAGNKSSDWPEQPQVAEKECFGGLKKSILTHALSTSHGRSRMISYMCSQSSVSQQHSFPTVHTCAWTTSPQCSNMRDYQYILAREVDTLTCFLFTCVYRSVMICFQSTILEQTCLLTTVNKSFELNQ